MDEKAARFELSEKELRRIVERLTAEGKMPSREEYERVMRKAFRGSHVHPAATAGG